MATAVHPFEGTYEVDPNHSSFQFAVRHLELSTFRASFADVSARLGADDGGLVLEGHARVESISIVASSPNPSRTCSSRSRRVSSCVRSSAAIA